MNTYKLALSIVAVSVLVACGGSSSRPSTIPVKPHQENKSDTPKPNKPNPPDKTNQPNNSDKPYKTLPPTAAPTVKPSKVWKPIDAIDNHGQKIAIYHISARGGALNDDPASSGYDSFSGEVKYKQKNFNAKQQYIYMMDNGQKINIADLSKVSPVDSYNYKLANLYAHNDPKLFEQFNDEYRAYAGTKISTALSYARFGIIQTQPRVDLFVQGQQTPVTAVPLTGRVKYQGDTITVSMPPDNDYGSIELTADFESKKITGSYQEFITNGRVWNIAADIKGNTFSGEYTGVELKPIEYTYTTKTQGSFFGPNGEEVAGIIENQERIVFGAKQVK